MWHFLLMLFFLKHTPSEYAGDCEDKTVCLHMHQIPCKLDGVGPVDNRPSTDKLHHFVPKKNKK